MKTYLFICFLVAFAGCFSVGVVSAVEFQCEAEPVSEGAGDTSSSFDSRSARVRLIYVSFPEDAQPVSSVLDAEHEAILTELRTYFSTHSRGNFSFAVDSDIILHSGDSFESGETITAWEAELAASAYRDFTTIPAEYPQVYADLSLWWSQTVGYASPLCAEILHKIWSEYSQTSDFFNNTDYLVMVFLTNNNPFDDDLVNGVSGRPEIYVNEHAIPTFFDGIGRNGSYLRGTVQKHLVHGQSELEPREMAKGIAHEIGHTFGLGDGPPNIRGYGWDEGRYYYGNQNLMSQTAVDGEGIPSIGLGWLQYLPWHGELAEDGFDDGEVVDFTGENLKGQIVTDIAQPGGKIYKFRLVDPVTGNEALDDQYFLFAFHAGTGIDDQRNGLNEPLMRSKGLEIWHCVGNEMFDIESAFGLYSDPNESLINFQDNNNAWDNVDLVSGYDNHDWWAGVSGVYSERDRYEYADYVGEEYDFFRYLEGGDPKLYNSVFSFSSNPNSYGYENDSAIELIKRKPQTISNSLYVKITEQDNNAGTMTVDFLSAPNEQVTIPTLPQAGSNSYPVGEPVVISWSDDFDIITSVDVLFSTNNGQSYVETQMEIDSAAGQYLWYPGSGDGTSYGKLKLLFHNDKSSYLGSFIYPDDCSSPQGLIVVDGPVIVQETLLAPNGGDILFTHTVNRIEWTSFFNTAENGGFGEENNVGITGVDLSVHTETGWHSIAAGLSIDQPGLVGDRYFYDPVKGVNFYNWTPEISAASPVGEILLAVESTTNGGLQQTSDNSDDDFYLYPISSRFVDKTAVVLFESGQEGYTGTPVNAISLDVDADGAQDLIVAMGEDSEGVSRLYRNDSGTILDLSNVFPGFSKPLDESTCIINADFNNDGYVDLFFGHKTDPRLFQNNGIPGALGFIDVGSSLVVLVESFLSSTNRASWVDWDHDGDLDLALGRGTQSDPGSPLLITNADYILLNKGSYSDWTEILIGDHDTFVEAFCVFDFDKDGYNEILVADYSNQVDDRLVVYKEGFDGGIQISQGAVPAEVLQNRIIGMEWFDYDNNGWFDLVLTRSGATPVLLINNQQGGFTEVLELGSEPVSILEVLDFNGDGWDDIIGNPQATSANLIALMNCYGMPGYPEGFLDVSHPIGLNILGESVNTVLETFFNDDGYPDLVLGNTGNSGRFFKATDPGNPLADPVGSWLGIRLDSGNGWNNAMGIGSVVRVQDSAGNSQWKLVDGGSGSGGQNSTTLFFGLNKAVPPLNISVYWPNGKQTSEVIQSIPNDVVLIQDNTGVALGLDAIGIADVQAISSLLPGSQQSIVIRWTTKLRCENSKDQLIIHNYYSLHRNCRPGAPAFNLNSLGVDYKMFLGTDGLYHHELTVLDVKCSPGCQFEFHVESGIGTKVLASDTYTFYHEACGISFTE